MTTPLQGLEEEIIRKRQEGHSVSSIAAEYNVSRQGVYYLLDREGVDTSRKKKPPRTKKCEVCNRTFVTKQSKTKTCSKSCARKLASLSRAREDSIFSKLKFVELVCYKCGKNFKRTQHQQNVSMKNKAKQRDFCSLACYRGRNK